MSWRWQLINVGVEGHFSVNRKGVRLAQVLEHGGQAGLRIIYQINGKGRRGGRYEEESWHHEE